MTNVNFRAFAGAAAIVAIIAIAGCGSTTTTNDVVDAYSDTVADLPADVVVDAADTNGGEVTTDINGGDVIDVNKCIEKIKDQNLFKVIDAQNPMQIHPSAAFDGEAVWLAWSDLDSETGLFEILAARMACDGSLLVQPFSVDPINPGNSYEAEVAFSNGNMMIAWHLDNSAVQGSSSASIPVRTSDSKDITEHNAGETPAPEDVIEDIAIPTDTAADAVQPDSYTDVATDVANDVPMTDTVQPTNDNMQVHYRTFKIDGTPLMDEALRYLPAVNGTAALVNNWLPKVVGLPDGRFAIASSWAWPGGMVFQAVAQRFNADGTKSGNLIHPFPMATIDQMYPGIAADADGSLHMVWSQTDAENSDITWIASTTILAGTEVPLEASPVLYPTKGDGPSVAANASGIITAYSDSKETPDITIVAETAARALTATTTLGDNGYDFAPVVVADDAGLAVAWFKIRSGYNCDMLVKKLAWNGGTNITSFGDPTVVTAPDSVSNHAALSVYGPGLVNLGEGNYFVFWSERQSETFAESEAKGYRIYGRFMKL